MARRSQPLASAPVQAPRLPSRGAWLRFAAVAAVAAGPILLGWQLGQPASPSPGSGAAAPPALEARLAALQDALTAEHAARESLALELAALRAQVDEISAQLPGGAPAPAAEAAAPTATAPSAEAGVEAAAAPPAPLFDVEALVAGCMHRSEAESLRTRWERYELDKLDLNDRAMREDFFMSPRHRDEHFALDAAFRNDVDEDGYDAYLRATGKPNRVTVREVLPAGAGRVAGLEVGDELVQYAGVRVFSTADLRLLTASGRLGETVAVEVMRGEQSISLRAVRGPLGIVFGDVQRAPQGGC
jgi:hypothetical protein